MARRSVLQRCRALDEVEIMSLKGATQTEIAAKLGVSQGQVSRDLVLINERRALANAAAIKELRDRELSKLDVIERECWAAWARSQEPKEVSAQEKTSGGEDGDKFKASLRSEGQVGNPAFIREILDCIKQRSSLLGLDAAKKIQMEGGDKPIQIIEVVAAEVRHHHADHLAPLAQVAYSDS
jgi:plasmid maintenance system antidote protein VapI